MVGMLLAGAGISQRKATLALLALLALTQLIAWGSFFILPRSTELDFSNFLEDYVPSLVVAISAPIYFAWKRLRGAVIAIVFTNTALVLLFEFSAFYWSSGTRVNFNIQLSHLDAIYFALGTLSTAGTGNIFATSELARGVQALQMVFDIVLLVFIAGLAVTRISEASPRKSN